MWPRITSPARSPAVANLLVGPTLGSPRLSYIVYLPSSPTASSKCVHFHERRTVRFGLSAVCCRMARRCVSLVSDQPMLPIARECFTTCRAGVHPHSAPIARQFSSLGRVCGSAALPARWCVTCCCAGAAPHVRSLCGRKCVQGSDFDVLWNLGRRRCERCSRPRRISSKRSRR